MYADNGPTAASVTVADVASGKIILRAPTHGIASRLFSSQHLQPVPFDWDTDGGALFLVQGDGDTLNLAIIRSGDVGARVHVPIPYLEQVLRLGTQFSASTVALAPAPARANTGLQVARVTASPTAPELDITDVDTDTVRRVILPERIPQAVAPNGSGDNRQVIALAGGFVVGTGREAFWVDDTVVLSLGATEQLTAGADQHEAWISRRSATGYEIARVDGENGALGVPITVRALPSGIVRDGFVAISPATFDRTAGIEVWNPTTRRTTRIDVDAAYPNLVATWGDAVAWINPDLCSDAFCPLATTDVRTRVTTATASVTGGSVYNQPGGVLYGHAGSGVITAYDLHTGSETRVPGSEDAEPEIVVSSSGWVIFNTPDGGRAWRPGLTAPAEVAPVVTGDAMAARSAIPRLVHGGDERVAARIALQVEAQVVHHVSERDAACGVRERERPARAGVPECARRVVGAEGAPQHVAEPERGFPQDDAVRSAHLLLGGARHGLRRERSHPVHLADQRRVQAREAARRRSRSTTAAPPRAARACSTSRRTRTGRWGCP